MQELTEVQKAYIAGIVDGEGCITIMKHKKKRCNIPSYELVVVVLMTSKAVVEWLHDVCEGSWMTLPKQVETNRQTYRFYTQGMKAISLLKSIEPYMVEKANQVSLALSYASLITGRGNKPTAEQLEQKESIFVGLKALHM